MILVSYNELKPNVNKKGGVRVVTFHRRDFKNGCFFTRDKRSLQWISLELEKEMVSNSKCNITNISYYWGRYDLY